MPRRKPRNLRPEEAALWQKVVEKAAPLRPDPVPEREMSYRPAAKPPTWPVPRFRPGEKAQTPPPAHNLAPTIADHVAAQPVAMDRKRYRKLKKGSLNPEARIDLHGMTIAQAHPALTRFILAAAGDGLRLVLVITGKGKTRPDQGPIPERHGVLRHQVPHWLNTPPLKAHVLQIVEAHVRHGGQGAYYVYLRRTS